MRGFPRPAFEVEDVLFVGTGCLKKGTAAAADADKEFENSTEVDGETLATMRSLKPDTHMDGSTENTSQVWAERVFRYQTSERGRNEVSPEMEKKVAEMVRGAKRYREKTSVADKGIDPTPYAESWGVEEEVFEKMIEAFHDLPYNDVQPQSMLLSTKLFTRKGETLQGTVKMLLDTGASHCVIDTQTARILKKKGFVIEKCPRTPLRAKAVGGEPVWSETFIWLSFSIWPLADKFMFPFYVADLRHSGARALVGLPLVHTYGMTIESDMWCVGWERREGKEIKKKRVLASTGAIRRFMQKVKEASEKKNKKKNVSFQEESEGNGQGPQGPKKKKEKKRQ